MFNASLYEVDLLLVVPTLTAPTTENQALRRFSAASCESRAKVTMHKLLWLAAGGLPLAFAVGYLIGRFLL